MLKSVHHDSACIPAGIALGCSKFGSIVNGVDLATAEKLVSTALECGVRHFDSADIYGQGESERILGNLLRNRRNDVFLATKVGQRFPTWAKLLRPLKAPLAALFASGPRGDHLSRLREKPLPRCYRPDYVARAVKAGLRRIGSDHVDLVYLHSPSAADLADGEAVGALERLREAGHVGLVGVSVDDVATASAALSDARISALQVPYSPGEAKWLNLLAKAGERKVAVVVRSLFSGQGRSLTEEERCAIVAAASSNPAIESVIVGTSNERHLRQIVSWAPARV